MQSNRHRRGSALFALYSSIWRVSARRQLALIVLSTAIAALAAVPLEIQKDIITHLIKSAIRPRELFLPGAGMMAVILLSLDLKWLMGYRSGLLGEAVIRLARIRQVETAAAEQDDATVPNGTLICVIGYIASTGPGLGRIALAMIFPQVILVYLSLQKVNAMLALRMHVLRGATNRITISGRREISRTAAEDFARIYEPRRRMFIWKLSTKFLLSSINGAGQGAVLMLGGGLVLRGRTDVGTIVAMGLSRIQGPRAFLVAFYRQVSANRVKFELLRERLAQIPQAGPSGSQT